jgi:large subunit ribosomal protein L3
MIGLLGKKIGITSIYDNNNNLIPITVIKNFFSLVINININTNQIQLGMLEIFKNSKKNTKSFLGHFIKQKLLPFNYIKTYKVFNVHEYFIGQEITNTIFNLNEKINVTSISIGKGFSGNIKAHHFKRGPESHGSKHHRLQGSLGAGTTPGRVFPGKKMSTHLGNKQCTILNLKVIDFYNDLILIKGSIPGKKGQLVNLNKNNK